ncbi:hypothetical protein EYV94_18140 [Puteibacter caeruleilacunae]|nr:hypothetical protein EYV94_18140 [Puteibacter caeruleilacunae]
MCKTLRYILPNDKILQINSNVIRDLSKFKQSTTTSNESGGILLGRILKNTNHLVIDEITTPTQYDIQRRNYFKRSKRPHQKIINKRWKESNQTQNYFGEWHTHAEENPSPSNTDLNDWKKRVIRDKLNLDFLISMIVGIKQTNVWITDRDCKTFKLILTNDIG